MSSTAHCVVDKDTQGNIAIEGPSIHSLATAAIHLQNSISENAAGNTSLASVTGLHSDAFINDDDQFSLFEPRSEIYPSDTPPKAVAAIFKALPSVANYFPQWPFHPVDLPRAHGGVMDEYDMWQTTERQSYGKELKVSRIHASSTAAFRLLNHSFKQEVKDFCAQYEIFRKNNFQPLPNEDTNRREYGTPFVFGVSRYHPQMHYPEHYTPHQGVAELSAEEVAELHNMAFKCSVCDFSPAHDDIPNWLYLTKDSDGSPRYYYCARCKSQDSTVKLKSFPNLMGMMKDIVAICTAEKNAKEMGMKGVLTSVPLARFTRFRIMFEIEVRAAMERIAIEAQTRELIAQLIKEEEEATTQEALSQFNPSYFGGAAATAIVGRYFNSQAPALFDTQPRSSAPETVPPVTQVAFRDRPARIAPVEDDEDKENTVPYIRIVDRNPLADALHDAISEPITERPSTTDWWLEEVSAPTPSPSSAAPSPGTPDATPSLPRGLRRTTSLRFEDSLYLMSLGKSPSPSRTSPLPPAPPRRTIYQTNPATIPTPTPHHHHHAPQPPESLTSIAEGEEDTASDSDFGGSDDTSQSDDSFDEAPRRMKCLEILDQFFPPPGEEQRILLAVRREAYARRLAEEKGRGGRRGRGRPVDDSLEIIAEEEEEEEGDGGGR